MNLKLKQTARDIKREAKIGARATANHAAELKRRLKTRGNDAYVEGLIAGLLIGSRYLGQISKGHYILK